MGLSKEELDELKEFFATIRQDTGEVFEEGFFVRQPQYQFMASALALLSSRRLEKGTTRLERLTSGLLVLTVVLAALTISDILLRLLV